MSVPQCGDMAHYWWLNYSNLKEHIKRKQLNMAAAIKIGDIHNGSVQDRFETLKENRMDIRYVTQSYNFGDFRLIKFKMKMWEKWFQEWALPVITFQEQSVGFPSAIQRLNISPRLTLTGIIAIDDFVFRLKFPRFLIPPISTTKYIKNNIGAKNWDLFIYLFNE